MQNTLGSTPEEQQHDPTHPRGIFRQGERLVSFAFMGNAMPPRDPDEDEEDEDKEEDEDGADEPPVVREPDED